jgi:hypothetical protein
MINHPSILKKGDFMKKYPKKFQRHLKRHLMTLFVFGCLGTTALYFGGVGGCEATDNDDTNPTVTATVPGHVDTDVPVNSKIVAEFSEEIDPATVSTNNFTVVGPDAAPVAGTVDIDADNRLVVFTPATNLAPDSLYTATLSTNVEDLSGNGLGTAYVWAFTTGSASDTTAPTVLSTDPVDTETSVARNQAISVTFNEAMDPLTLNADDFTVTGPNAASVSGTVSYDLVTNVATFTPTNALAANTIYTVRVTSEAEDLAGNSLTADHVLEFTTGSL